MQGLFWESLEGNSKPDKAEARSRRSALIREVVTTTVPADGWPTTQALLNGQGKALGVGAGGEGKKRTGMNAEVAGGPGGGPPHPASPGGWTRGGPKVIPPTRVNRKMRAVPQDRLCPEPGFHTGSTRRGFIEKCGGKRAWEAGATRVSRPGEVNRHCPSSSGTRGSRVAGTWPQALDCDLSCALIGPASGAWGGASSSAGKRSCPGAQGSEQRAREPQPRSAACG